MQPGKQHLKGLEGICNLRALVTEKPVRNDEGGHTKDVPLSEMKHCNDSKPEGSFPVVPVKTQLNPTYL